MGLLSGLAVEHVALRAHGGGAGRGQVPPPPRRVPQHQVERLLLPPAVASIPRIRHARCSTAYFTLKQAVVGVTRYVFPFSVPRNARPRLEWRR
eukprot:1166942-Prorocentrum_minimum.AAC.2